jgi:hypothetical protein
MTCNDEDHDSSMRPERPGADDRGWSHMLVTQWSDDRDVG